MDQFDALWTMLRQHGSSAKREHECVQLWRTYSPTLQQQIFNAICSKLEHNKFVHYDPLRAIQENARAVHDGGTRRMENGESDRTEGDLC